jgi:two-component system phosphate regulon sensor histidine kinase PhoR
LTSRIFVKLLLAVISVLVVALIAVDLLASRVAESTYIGTLRQELASKGRMLAKLNRDGFEGVSARTMQELARSAGARLTVVRRNGSVVADSEANPERMENHSNRPELIAAFEGREGSNIRQSPTVGEKFLYVAVPMGDRAMRLAVRLSEIDAQVNEIRRRMLASTVLAFLPAILIAALFARHVSSKLGKIIAYASELARGNYRARLEIEGHDELGVLSKQLKESGEKLERAVEDLQREHSELEKLERIRKDFVINVSHELRTPLASIQGYTETLLDGALHDAEHNVRFLQIIRQNTERLGRLVEDLMMLSGLELKTRKLQFRAHELNELLEEAIDLMGPMARKKKIEIRQQPAPEGTEVFCDREAVHQVLSNLMDNALKYTPEGGAVTLGARRGDPFAEVFVEDTGIGIPPEELPRLFERFYRVDKARSRELGGTGLGLSIVKHLVRAQGGDVRVASEPGKGSRFTFTLPLRHSLRGAATGQGVLINS